MSAPAKGSYWVGRASGDTFKVDGILNLGMDNFGLDGADYQEDRVIFTRVAPASKSGLTFTLPVSRWEEFAREP